MPVATLEKCYQYNPPRPVLGQDISMEYASSIREPSARVVTNWSVVVFRLLEPEGFHDGFLIV